MEENPSSRADVRQLTLSVIPYKKYLETLGQELKNTVLDKINPISDIILVKLQLILPLVILSMPRGRYLSYVDHALNSWHKRTSDFCSSEQ